MPMFMGNYLCVPVGVYDEIHALPTAKTSW